MGLRSLKHLIYQNEKMKNADLNFQSLESDVELWLMMLSSFWGPLKLYVKAKKAQIFLFLTFVGLPYSCEF